MLILAIGLTLFLGVHFLGIVPKMQAGLKTRFGPGQYKLIYTAISLLGFGLIIWGKMLAHPTPTLYVPEEWARNIALIAVPIAMILIVSSFAPGHIRHHVGHPMLAGVMVWSASHLLANGESSAVLLFGSFLIWSSITFVTHTLRDTPPPVVKGWGGDLTAIIIGFLIAMILMRFHMNLFGIAIL